MSTAPALCVPEERSSAAQDFAELRTTISFIIADLVAIGTGFSLAVWFRSGFTGSSLWPQHLRLAPCLLIIPLLFFLQDLYPGVLSNPVDEFREVTKSVVSGMGIVIALTFLLKTSAEFSRAALLITVPLAIILVLLSRFLTRALMTKTTWWGIPAVLLGPRADLTLLQRKVNASPYSGLRIRDSIVCDAVTLPSQAALARTASGSSYAIVLIPPGADSQWLHRVERRLWDRKKIIFLHPTMSNLSTWVRIRDCWGAVGIESHRELLLPRSRALKQSVDCCLAAAFALLILPTSICIGILVALTSKGPVFYGQRRIGKNGKPFRAWKFRTMVEDADSILEYYLAKRPELREEWEATHKLRNDPRVTAVGRYLRAVSLDELPQIWNVLCGDMSLVGPRPIVQDEVEKYEGEFELYKKVRPGLTGLWQVSGRSNTTYQERVKMDSFYVRNWSVWLDLYLLVRTVDVVLRKRGAY